MVVGEETEEQDCMTEGKESGAEGGGRVHIPAALDDQQHQEPLWDRDGRVPEQKGEAVKVPRVELIVQGPSEHHPNKV